MKQLKRISKLAIAASLLATTAMAAEGDSPLAKEDRSRLDSLVTKVQKITSKAGLSFGGNFESRAFSSKIEGDSVNSGNRTREDIMSTTLDLEMRARPIDAISGTLILRLHEDWRNMFGASGTPLQTRWLSIDGNVKKVFFYSAGDYKVKLSPYTIWAPTPTIDFEPEIFARNREDVMREVFAGDNNRILQGANIAFRASMMPAFHDFGISVTGARLRKGGLTVEHGPFSPTALDTAQMDRYLFAANLNMMIREDLGLGFTYLRNGDATATFDYGTSIQADTAQRVTSVISTRGTVGTAFIEAIDAEKIKVTLNGELALSNDRDTIGLDIDSSVSSVDGSDTTWKYDSTVTDKKVAGMGLYIGGDVQVGLAEAGRLTLKAGYTLNNEKFRNEAAQSPVFWKNNIINTEALASVGDMNRMYNPFDALYKHVYKFAPSSGSANNLDYKKMPMNKVAWTKSTFTYKELAKAAGSSMFMDKASYVAGANESAYFDTDLMPIMTFGQATANRAGLNAELSGVFVDSAIAFKGLFTTMQQATGDKIEQTIDLSGKTLESGFDADDISGEKSFEGNIITVSKEMDKTKYMQFGGGLSMNVAKFGDWWKFPIVLSGSYKMTNIDGMYPVYVETLNNAGDAISSIALKSEAYKKGISFMNAGGYFKFYKKAAILGGFQKLSTTNDYTKVDRNYSQWSAGLEFKVNEGGTVTATYGQITNELDVDGTKDDITQGQMDLLLTVKF